MPIPPYVLWEACGLCCARNFRLRQNKDADRWIVVAVRFHEMPAGLKKGSAGFLSNDHTNSEYEFIHGKESIVLNENSCVERNPLL